MEENFDQAQQTSSGQDQPIQSVRAVKKSSGKNKIFWLFILILVIGGLAFGGYYLLQEPDIESSEENNVQEENIQYEQPSPIPEPTEEPVEREGISINILNGTGIEGEASYLQGKLRDLGYESIDVANAKEQENEEASVTFSGSLPETVMEELTDYLKKLYKEIDFTVSKTNEEYDVEIITGLRSGQSLPTPVPTKKITPSPTASSSATPTP